jgi:catechol 2,3-dioxygenase-like lactoylglutathione lyase family enzyme
VPGKFNDIAAVIATKDYAAARAWYVRVLGREPDLEPIEGVADPDGNEVSFVQDLRMG